MKQLRSDKDPISANLHAYPATNMRHLANIEVYIYT